MPVQTTRPASAPAPPDPGEPFDARPSRGLLASMRIRKKLIFLHSLFSLILASILLIAVRPAVQRAVAEAEGALADREVRALSEGAELLTPGFGDLLTIRRGDPDSLALKTGEADRLRTAGGSVIPLRGEGGWTWRGAFIGGEAIIVGARLESARHAAGGVYALLILALIGVYALIAVALEIFVLPRHVYGPIGMLLEADRAVARGDSVHELVPEHAMPADELGEIMRSRNSAIRGVRRQEAALAHALDDLEVVAADLKRKNHLLETAKRNLEGADRLLSLGMMSAGIAHELNTPLAVAKGLAEKLAASPHRSLSTAEADLLTRVVGRLERLSEGLLDFARAREPAYAPAPLAPIVEEAITLVRLDRVTHEIEIANAVRPDLVLQCDADRMVQVFVNLVRNAVDAIRGGGASRGTVEIDAMGEDRDGEGWVTIRVRDDGPGIDPDVLPTLFEPFVSTRLDSKGTGLGLAVAEGIVREHAGTIIARNRRDGRGAVFEIMMPSRPPHSAPATDETGRTA